MIYDTNWYPKELPYKIENGIGYFSYSISADGWTGGRIQKLPITFEIPAGFNYKIDTKKDAGKVIKELRTQYANIAVINLNDVFDEYGELITTINDVSKYSYLTIGHKTAIGTKPSFMKDKHV